MKVSSSVPARKPKAPVVAGFAPGAVSNEGKTSDSSGGREGKPEPSKANRLHVNVTVQDPTIVLLEDPLVRNSRGILAGCVVSVHFTREFDDRGDLETEQLQLSLRDTDISVSRNIEHRDGAVRVLEPCTIEAHLKTSFHKNNPFAMNLSLVVNQLLKNIKTLIKR